MNDDEKIVLPEVVPIERLVNDVLGVEWTTPNAPVEIRLRESRIGRAVTNLVIALRTQNDNERRDAFARAAIITATLAAEDLP